MTVVQLIKLVQDLARLHRKRIFTLREIATLARVSPAAAGMALLRAREKGIVSRIANHWINLMDPPELTELALAVSSPSYISFESALYHHGIISQSPLGSLTVAVRGRPRQLVTTLGRIQLIHLKPSLFFGYDSNRMALPEKAWLDLLYIRGRKGREALLSEEVYGDRLNKKRLLSFARKFPRFILP